MAKILLSGSDASDRRVLALATKEGHDIENEQCRDALTAGNQLEVSDLKRQYPAAIVRGESTPHYNCHGLAFACRRTGIHKQEALRRILADDHYRPVTADKILPGDIVFYFDQDENDIVHTGVIVGTPSSNAKEIWVVSKWGSGPEFVHKLQDCPYKRFAKHFYRMSP